jgi:hypothetical protein
VLAGPRAVSHGVKNIDLCPCRTLPDDATKSLVDAGFKDGAKVGVMAGTCGLRFIVRLCPISLEVVRYVALCMYEKGTVRTSAPPAPALEKKESSNRLPCVAGCGFTGSVALHAVEPA